MNKTIKRIIVVFSLILITLLFGYSCSTGSRISNYPKDYNEIREKYYANETIKLKFQPDGDNLYLVDNSVITIRQTEYKDGIVYCTDGETEYEFVVIQDCVIYDKTNKQFLYEGGI